MSSSCASDVDDARPIDTLTEEDRPLFGGKAVVLGALARSGCRVPAGLALSTRLYHRFVDRTGVRGRILIEFNRKPFADMRWEEMWDASLRIRNLFATAPWPAELREPLAERIGSVLGSEPVAVRSSAPGEDGRGASFAGVHASFVNVRGTRSILEHVKLVWASLFSDAALLYAGELGLDVFDSAMAVVVQTLVSGERSGVVFTRGPTDESTGVIEAVHGLNQGLVDGTIQPDRWTISRATGRPRSHRPADRTEYIVPRSGGVEVAPLPPELRSRPPLEERDVERIWSAGIESERMFGSPQDVEWTIAEDDLVLLQARPITTLRPQGEDDKRGWYLSLRRSQANLERLRTRIEDELLPAMEHEADGLARTDLTGLGDEELDLETEHRAEIYRRWRDVYWEEFIPFAHGARLFGEFYNAALSPSDPYEFVELLEGTGLKSVERNTRMQVLAARLESEGEDACAGEVDELLERFGGVFAPTPEHRAGMLRLLRGMGGNIGKPAETRRRHREELERRYLDHFTGAERERAGRLLDLARVSHRLRDDDNIYLGRIEAQWRAAQREQRRRGRAPAAGAERTGRADEFVRTASRLGPRDPGDAVDTDERLRPRQIVGQPAGPGVARGRARVVRNREDLFAFERGEVLVCDAVDPNMTFVVPLAAAVAERRGGMLIHGAIIAREYGLPCVTGIPGAIDRIHTGDEVTVDGYLGIVTVHDRPPPSGDGLTSVPAGGNGMKLA
jgi:pyruvate,water dikinase